MQIAFIELMEIHAMRGTHFPAPFTAPLLRSISRCGANGFPHRPWVSPPKLPVRARHINELMTVACFIRRWGAGFPCGLFGFVLKFFRWGTVFWAGGWAAGKGQF